MAIPRHAALLPSWYAGQTRQWLQSSNPFRQSPTQPRPVSGPCRAPKCRSTRTDLLSGEVVMTRESLPAVILTLLIASSVLIALRRVPIDARPGFVLASPVASTPAPPPSASLAARLLGLSDPLPPGIAVSDLGSGHTTSLSQGPVRIILERLSVAGGADLAARPVSGATTLLLVEAGTLTLIDELGLEAVATEGAYQLIPPTGD